MQFENRLHLTQAPTLPATSYSCATACTYEQTIHFWNTLKQCNTLVKQLVGLSRWLHFLIRHHCITGLLG